MHSNEFDFELLKHSENFGIKKYRDSIYKGELRATPESGNKPKRHGKGVCVYGNGRIYEGNWEDDQRSGRGFELFSNGNSYQGEYK